jgi:hypothetical protein
MKPVGTQRMKVSTLWITTPKPQHSPILVHCRKVFLKTGKCFKQNKTGYERRVNAEGKAYFVDHTKKITTWDDPRPKIVLHQKISTPPVRTNAPAQNSIPSPKVNPAVVPPKTEVKANSSTKKFLIDFP